MKYKFKLIALSYLIFVFYGSLVPLEFQYIPFSQAIQKFMSIPYLHLSVNSRADWVANGLLFIPLTFLLMASFWSNKLFNRNILLSIAVIVLSLCLPILIEFTQLFFPRRTVSQNDIMAEFIGGIIGVALWWIFYDKTINFIEHWFNDNLNNKWQIYLSIYLGCMFAYSVMPLDLTISPKELYTKWNNGLLVLLPFDFVKQNIADILYDIIADIILWVPVTLLWLKGNLNTTNKVYARVILSATIIEFCQIFIYSRYTDINDILTAFLGAIVGVYIAKKTNLLKSKATNSISKGQYFYLIGIFAYLIWLGVLSVIYWYPFNFNLTNINIEASLRGFFSVPFASYYLGSEYLAITQIFRKLLFAIPLGASIGLYFLSNNVLTKKSEKYITYVILFSSLFFLELLQVLIADRTANFTDVCIAFIGALIGYNVIMKFFTQYKNSEIIYPQRKVTNSINHSRYFPMVLGVLFIYVLLLIAHSLPGVPYNVKEIYEGNNVYIGALIFSIILFHVFGFPMALLQQLLERNTCNLKNLLLVIISHIGITWLLVRLFIPTESIHDILGSPVWGGVPEVELLFRFIGLFSLFSTAIFCVSMTILPTAKVINKNLLRISVWLFFGLLILPFNYLVIIVLAGTDNITELLINEGYSFHGLYIVTYLISTLFLALHLVMAIVNRSLIKIVKIVLFIVITTPVMYWLIQSGTDNYIIKYNKVFSALQFLLSANRDAYIAPKLLFYYFSAAHISLVTLIVITQWHLWFRGNTKVK
tara:strand:+ start:12686 stop:14968 length:2283 start_codon:yes stop_codon:yes gene_type:complete